MQKMSIWFPGIVIIGWLLLLLPGILLVAGNSQAIEIYGEWRLYTFRWLYIFLIALYFIGCVVSTLPWWWKTHNGQALPYFCIRQYLLRDPEGKIYERIRTGLHRISGGVSHRYLLFLYSRMMELEDKTRDIVESLDRQQLSNVIAAQDGNGKPSDLFISYLGEYGRYIRLASRHTCPQGKEYAFSDGRLQVVLGLIAARNHYYAELLVYQAINRNSKQDEILELVTETQKINQLVKQELENKRLIQRSSPKFREKATQLISTQQMLFNIQGTLPSDEIMYEMLLEIEDSILKYPQLSKNTGKENPRTDNFSSKSYIESRDFLSENGSLNALLISQTRLLCTWLLHAGIIHSGCQEMISLYQGLEKNAPIAIMHPRTVYAYGLAWQRIATACRTTVWDEKSPDKIPQQLSDAATKFARIFADSALVEAGATSWFIESSDE